jgi:hypothetical protein
VIKTAITTTTINIPMLIEDYLKDISKSGHGDTVHFIIAGDHKTPAEAKDFCRMMESQYGVPVLFMDVSDQERYLSRFPRLKGFLPWNCIQRRQVAILKAYDLGADVIVLVDDDNFIACEDYVGSHLHLGKRSPLNVVSSPTGWYNICDDLEDRHGRKFYPRGYSWPERAAEVRELAWTKKNVRSVVNAGFWLGDPDIDAVTRLAAPIDVVAFRRAENYALDVGVFSPFNSQNTAIHSDVVPAYFLVPDIGRFDDIWASYIVERLAWHMGDSVTYGQPLVRQERNEHDLWIDVRLEEMGTIMTPDFCRWLRDVQLTERGYLACAHQLINDLKEIMDRQPNNVLPYARRAYMNHIVDGYRIWFETCSIVKG